MHFFNPGRTPYTQRDRELIGAEHARRARAHFARHPAYRPTPVHTLTGLGGAGTVHVKDESGRMGLGSFKALGGAYAVHRLSERDGGGTTYVCASAGNHGISVAAGARELGARCVVYLSHGVPEPFAHRLRALDAEVRREGDDYDASLAAALHASQEHGWRLVADTSWEGYSDIPLDVMRGYTVLFDEIEIPPTHLFVQAGVGGLAAAAAGYARDRWGERPTVVVVEPEGAPCLLESARAGEPVHATGAPTRLGRLDCLEPSLLAFDLLRRQADLFVTVADEQAAEAAALLAGEGVALSECGAAGAAGLLALDPGTREAPAPGPAARVLLVGTEGPVEPK
ncbi:PLP-dependent lyase/thiolase [Nonomuraea sp. WAC 01424]|uniref:pyridoxal-phosphate dependent enzyme n=1 Tax=Nonomuraea sp. WAC 01424 TaxID=2203200 RepID=UPI000F79207D|nr:pyridoxal-phosphate dependent enzyme [Nonomuraea sp. WAC 01424]RSN02608.1 PLP-dependent lyase/thiolase [Nonomuraea sp. WAC 01424]